MYSELLFDNNYQSTVAFCNGNTVKVVLTFKDNGETLQDERSVLDWDDAQFTQHRGQHDGYALWWFKPEEYRSLVARARAAGVK